MSGEPGLQMLFAVVEDFPFEGAVATAGKRDMPVRDLCRWGQTEIADDRAHSQGVAQKCRLSFELQIIVSCRRATNEPRGIRDFPLRNKRDPPCPFELLVVERAAADAFAHDGWSCQWNADEHFGTEMDGGFGDSLYRTLEFPE